MQDRIFERVIAYVDGFNLYFGLREKAFQRYYWLNIQTLAKNLLRPCQKLVKTKYFTARISGPKQTGRSLFAEKVEAKRRRQTIFLEALETLTDFEIYYGHYLGKVVQCRNCGRNWPDH